MTGELFLSLLNPALAALLSASFSVLWFYRRNKPHLLLLAMTFGACGLAFGIQDLLLPFDTPESRLITNGLFLVALLALCTAGLLRVNAPIPVAAFALLSAAGMAALSVFAYWYPSLSGRIYAVNITFSLIAGVTLWHVIAAGPRDRTDWLVVAVAGVGLLISITRPAFTLIEGYDGLGVTHFQRSTYWMAVQVMTAVLAVSVALAFLAATVAEIIAELRLEAQQDALSGLLNRSGFETAAQQALSGQRDGSWPAAVLLADLDDFKKINDTYGHAAGDSVIAEIGRLLRVSGKTQIAGRIGGEEFALFYRGLKRGDVQAIAEDLLAALRLMEVSGLPRDQRITMSIGVHVRAGHESLQAMLASADSALYDAKRGGKNRVALTPFKLRAVIDDPAFLSTFAAMA